MVQGTSVVPLAGVAKRAARIAAFGKAVAQTGCLDGTLRISSNILLLYITCNRRDIVTTFTGGTADGGAALI